jgi:hypothetical protein
MATIFIRSFSAGYRSGLLPDRMTARAAEEGSYYVDLDVLTMTDEDGRATGATERLTVGSNGGRLRDRSPCTIRPQMELLAEYF